MHLTDQAVKAARTKNIQPLIQRELNCSISSFLRYTSGNADNGRLTTPGVLAILERETGIPRDALLEPAYQRSPA